MGGKDELSREELGAVVPIAVLNELPFRGYIQIAKRLGDDVSNSFKNWVDRAQAMRKEFLEMTAQLLAESISSS